MITKKQEPCTRCDSSEKELYCSYCERCNDCCDEWEKHGRMSMAEKGHTISFDRTWDAIKKDDWYESPGRDDEIPNDPRSPFEDGFRMFNERIVSMCRNLFLSTLRPLLETQDQNGYVRNAVLDEMGHAPTDEEIEAGRELAMEDLDQWMRSRR